MDFDPKLLSQQERFGYDGRVAVTAHNTIDADQLRKAGADQVLIPYSDAAMEAVDQLFGKE